jgi:hypothetical protein
MAGSPFLAVAVRKGAYLEGGLPDTFSMQGMSLGRMPDAKPGVYFAVLART